MVGEGLDWCGGDSCDGVSISAEAGWEVWKYEQKKSHRGVGSTPFTG